MAKVIGYTPQMLEWLEVNQAGISRQELTDKFNKRFGVTVNVGSIINLCARKKWISGLTGHLKKGSTPWNKGVKLTEEQVEILRQRATGRKHSEETLAKMRMRTHTEETKQKMREAKLGRSLREETKQKLRIAMLGQKRGPEFAAKVSEAKRGKSNGRLGHMVAEETKKRIGDAQRGELNHMAGRKHTPETREKMRIAHMKRNKPQAYLAWVAEGNVPTPAEENT